MNKTKTLHVVSHTHWDREWYLTFQQYRYRLLKLVDHLLQLFEDKPDYQSFMMDGHFLLLKDYLELRPEKAGQIRDFVASGRMLIGPWYVQPNEFMVSGESMIRNLMLGIRESHKLGGCLMVGYLPDAFGHVSQLPQIMQGFGISEIVAMRGLPANAKTVFNWTGADGSQCLMLYMIKSYGNARDLPLCDDDYTEYIDGTSYQREGLKKRLNDILSILEPRLTSTELLLMNGVDHTFAQENLPEIIYKINNSWPGIKAVHSSLPDYIHEVRKYHELNQKPFEQFTGEQRDCSDSSILEGSQSVHVDVKQSNRHLEDLFEKWMEPFSAYAWMLGSRYPHEEIWQAWEYLLQNHAHDSLACSSVDATYQQVMTRFAWAKELGSEIVTEHLQLIARQVATPQENPQAKWLVVFNPSDWQRDEVITTTLDVPVSWNIGCPALLDEDQAVPLVVNHKHAAVTFKFNPRRGHLDAVPVDRYELSLHAAAVPAHGYKVLELVNGAAPYNQPVSMITRHHCMENSYLSVHFHTNGTFDLVDKQSGHVFKSLHFFQDLGEAGNGFEHKKVLADTVIDSTCRNAQISIVRDTELEAAFKSEIEMPLPCSLDPDRQSRSRSLVICRITSIIKLRADTKRLDIETCIDNTAGDHWLRVLFPTELTCSHSWAEQPFDVVSRSISLPVYKHKPVEQPSAAHPQLSFVDVSDGITGLMIANQGLYEYEVMDNSDRSIAISLLRCTDRLYSGVFAECEETRIPQAQKIGRHVFSYSVISHLGDWKNGYREAYQFRHPLSAVMQYQPEETGLAIPSAKLTKKKLPLKLSFLNVQPDNLIVSAVKKHASRESLVIRLFNPEIQMVHAKLKICCPEKSCQSAYRVNLNEERECELPVHDDWIEAPLTGKGLLTVECLFEQQESEFSC